MQIVLLRLYLFHVMHFRHLKSFCGDVHSLSLCLPVQRGHVSLTLQSASLGLYLLHLKRLFACMYSSTLHITHPIFRCSLSAFGCESSLLLLVFLYFFFLYLNLAKISLTSNCIFFVAFFYCDALWNFYILLVLDF